VKHVEIFILIMTSNDVIISVFPILFNCWIEPRGGIIRK